MTKEETRELLDDYINFTMKQNNHDPKLFIQMKQAANSYVEGVIEK